jgi:hypothetical protein
MTMGTKTRLDNRMTGHQQMAHEHHAKHQDNDEGDDHNKEQGQQVEQWPWMTGSGPAHPGPCTAQDDTPRTTRQGPCSHHSNACKTAGTMMTLPGCPPLHFVRGGGSFFIHLNTLPLTHVLCGQRELSHSPCV